MLRQFMNILLWSASFHSKSAIDCFWTGTYLELISITIKENWGCVDISAIRSRYASYKLVSLAISSKEPDRKAASKIGSRDDSRTRSANSLESDDLMLCSRISIMVVI